MFDLWSDLRYACRRLAAHSGYTTIMIATLALAIGATTAVFTVVDETLLRYAPFAFADRLVDVHDTNRATGAGGSSLTPEKIAGWQASPLFERFEGYSPRSVDLAGEGEPESAFGLIVTTGLFSMLGVHPMLGRTFASDEGRPGSARVVMIGEGLWKRRFGATPDVLGRTLMLDDEPYTIVGVMPRRFRLLGSLTSNDAFWLPIDVAQPGSEANATRFYGIGRLAPHVPLHGAQECANALADEYQKARPLPRTWDLRLRPKTVSSAGASTRTVLFVLLGAVAFVLLIACANVANLFLSRAAAREREIAVRSALGASRARLIRDVLTESVLLAAIGGAAGILLAMWGVRAAVAAAPATLAFGSTTTIEIDGRILAAASLLTMAAGVLVGLVPALRGSRPDVERTLRASSQTLSTHGRFGMSSALVVIEVALALVLLMAAALMMRTFNNVHAIDPGFDMRDLLTMRVSLPSHRYPTEASRFAFTRELTQRLATLPQVSAVTVASYAGPPGVAAFTAGVEGEHQGRGIDSRAYFAENVVAANYFQTLRIPMLSGRSFSTQDSEDALVVSQAVVDHFWPRDSAIGRRLRLSPTAPWLTVVGVVGNVEMRIGDDRVPRQLYTLLDLPRVASIALPLPPRRTYSSRVLTIRATSARAVLPQVKAQVWALDRNLPLENATVVQNVWNDAFGRQRFALQLMAAFAAIALVLAAAGIFAVLSQLVSQRTREIGVRVALGATPRDVFQLIVGRGMALTAAGVVIGIAGATALTRFVESLLFETSPHDPLSVAAVSGLLIVVAFLACWLPTRRAMRIDPAVALRVE